MSKNIPQVLRLRLLLRTLLQLAWQGRSESPSTPSRMPNRVSDRWTPTIACAILGFDYRAPRPRMTSNSHRQPHKCRYFRFCNFVHLPWAVNEASPHAGAMPAFLYFLGLGMLPVFVPSLIFSDTKNWKSSAVMGSIALHVCAYLTATNHNFFLLPLPLPYSYFLSYNWMSSSLVYGS